MMGLSGPTGLELSQEFRELQRSMIDAWHKGIAHVSPRGLQRIAFPLFREQLNTGSGKHRAPWQGKDNVLEIMLQDKIMPNTITTDGAGSILAMSAYKWGEGLVNVDGMLEQGDTLMTVNFNPGGIRKALSSDIYEDPGYMLAGKLVNETRRLRGYIEARKDMGSLVLSALTHDAIVTMLEEELNDPAWEVEVFDLKDSVYGIDNSLVKIAQGRIAKSMGSSGVVDPQELRPELIDPYIILARINSRLL